MGEEVGLLGQILRVGYAQVPAVIGPSVVDCFVEQLGAELEADDGHAADRTAKAVSLKDCRTWPDKGARRVVECTPDGAAPHWDALLSSPALRAALDEVLGEGGWEVEVNRAEADGSPPKVRMWYCPITFPEAGPAAAAAAAAPAAAAPPGARQMLLCSWKEERRLNGPLDAAAAASRWQPVNRRRVCGKGWHVDIGPGFPTDGVRTVAGDPRQGLVLLLLLSDWAPGGGGTAVVPGSHRWVGEQLAATGGMVHSELNAWCIERMLRLAREGRVELQSEGSGGGAAPDGPVQVRQVVGRRGDVVLLHPWLIHGGTTNFGTGVRILANGMVRLAPQHFARHGCRLFPLV